MIRILLSPFSFGSAILLGCLLLPISLSARTSDPFIGFWEIEEAAGDTAVIIVKRGGRLSKFWSGSGSSELIQGRFTMEGSVLMAEWDSGLRERYTLVGETSINRETTGPRGEVRVDRGFRVDPRIPGSLTTGSRDVPRERERDADRLVMPTAESVPADVALRSLYAGYWQIEQGTGFLGMGGGQTPHFYLHLLRGGNARVALRNWDAPNDQTGEWVIDSDRVLITWADGRKDILRQRSDEQFEMVVFERARHFPDRPGGRRIANRVTAAEGMRYFDAAEFRMLNVSDIRGRWVPLADADSPEFLQIDQWGQATRNRRGNDPAADTGQWRLLRDRVVINWGDGSREVLRSATRSFVIETFAPGTSLSGNPDSAREVRRASDEAISQVPGRGRR
ncbi:MAG: hypothetical protein JJT96_02905 [Opitutales bacterium]|nr:hypothetical protein [Opitutales bacterium]